MSKIDPSSPEVITGVLNEYLNIFSENFYYISKHAHELMWMLIIIEIVLLGMVIALGKQPTAVEFFSKILTIGIFLFLLGSYVWLLNTLFYSFLKAGLISSGDALSASETLDPASLFERGLKAAEPIWNDVEKTGSVWFNIARLFPLMLMAMIMLMSYAFMALQIALTVLEFYIVSSLAILFLPFGINKKLSFLADKAIAGIIASGFKMMVMAAVTGASIRVLSSLTSTINDITMVSMFSYMGATMLIAMIMWRAPAIASGMISGTSNLDVGNTIIQPAALAFTGAVMGGRLGKSAAKGVYSGASGGAKNVASSIRNVISAAKVSKK